MEVEHWDQRNPPAFKRRGSCEMCWNDAFSRSYGTSRDQVEVYHELLRQRKSNPCSPKDQAGEWWNDQLGMDERWLL